LNRQQRRHPPKIDKEKVRKLSDFIDAMNDSKLIISEGTKVKLNTNQMKSHPDYKNLVPKYRDWVEDNQDKIFTVIYDENKKNKPVLVCLKEDTTNPKWLFWTGDLIIV
jgi:hypothetical protein